MTRTTTSMIVACSLACLIATATTPRAATQQDAAKPKRQTGNNNRIPVITMIAPPAATVGESVQWRVTGTNLTHVKSWLVAGEGVTVTPTKPATDTEAELTVVAAPGAVTGFRELRALGNEGLSNLKIVRVDTLAGNLEVEPNEDPAQGQTITPNQVLHGVLKAKDVDYYKIDLKAGQRVVFEVEAQRLGQPVMPVLSLARASGQAIAQATDTRGLEHDARIEYAVDADGAYILQVREALYGGSDSAQYRLRVTESPVATALFPLAAARGTTVTFEASGGALDTPRQRALEIPKTAGRWFETGAFDSPRGPVQVPMRVLVTEADSEPLENEATATPAGMPLPFGARVNGRLSKPGEIDRYQVPVEKGKSLLVRIRAADMGSWLDSVIRVLDDKGNVLGENDDAGIAQNDNNVNPFGSQPATTSDSRLDVSPASAGTVTIEVADRYGDGGPEYGYRLEVGPAEPDFSISLLFGDPNLGRRRAFGQQIQTPRGPGANGALNLRPGTSVPINFVVSSDGSIGKIQVRAEGLPEGVTAAPVTINLPVAPAGRNRNATASGGAIVLKTAPLATANLGQLRLVAAAKPNANAAEIVHLATARILVEGAVAGGDANSARVVVRELDALPVWVAGRVAPTTEESTDSASSAVRVLGADVPGVLLQGAQLNIALRLDPPVPASGKLDLAAESLHKGVVAQTLVTENPTDSAPPAVVRVIAGVNAAPGVATIRVHARVGGAEDQYDVPVIIRAPAQLHVTPASLDLSGPDATTTIRVSAQREPGFNGPLELRIATPKGVRIVEPTPWTLTDDSITLTLTGKPELETGQTAIEPLDIQASARMPRGIVWVRSPIRPMFSSARADETDVSTSNKTTRADVKSEGGL